MLCSVGSAPPWKRRGNAQSPCRGGRPTTWSRVVVARVTIVILGLIERDSSPGGPDGDFTHVRQRLIDPEDDHEELQVETNNHRPEKEHADAGKPLMSGVIIRRKVKKSPKPRRS
jgi:hypothetical protein